MSQVESARRYDILSGEYGVAVKILKAFASVFSEGEQQNRQAFTSRFGRIQPALQVFLSENNQLSEMQPPSSQRDQTVGFYANTCIDGHVTARTIKKGEGMLYEIEKYHTGDDRQELAYAVTVVTDKSGMTPIYLKAVEYSSPEESAEHVLVGGQVYLVGEESMMEYTPLTCDDEHEAKQIRGFEEVYRDAISDLLGGHYEAITA